MAAVIKAGRVIPSGTPIQHGEFNLEDMSQHADRYLGTVREKAAEIVRSAQRQAEQVAAEATAQGRAAAEHAARQAAFDELERRWKTLAPALQQAIQTAAELRTAWVGQWEKNLARLATGIAERVIRRELTKHPEISQQWVREALELASGSTAITLLLHPADFEAIEEHREMLQQQFSQLAEAKIVADPQISPGGCRVVTSYGSIDQQIETQLSRIEEELTRD